MKHPRLIDDSQQFPINIGTMRYSVQGKTINPQLLVNRNHLTPNRPCLVNQRLMRKLSKDHK